MLNYKIKNKEITLVLCILGGWLGLHHFYNKQYKKGFLYIFTYGIFFIGWFIDIYKILKVLIKKEKTTHEKKYCHNCSFIIEDKDLYCSNCGANLKENYLEKYHLDNNFKVTINFGDDYERPEISLYKKNKTKKLVNDYIVFDLETTGLDCNCNNIIEIGALKYKNNELVDKFSVLINPQEHISSRITKITGITDEMVKDCETINTILPKFIQWIEDCTLIAHNGSFDLGFIESNIKRLNLNMINNKIIDTLYLAREFINDVPNHKLETLKQHFNLQYGSHRALEDKIG